MCFMNELANALLQLFEVCGGNVAARREDCQMCRNSAETLVVDGCSAFADYLLAMLSAELAARFQLFQGC